MKNSLSGSKALMETLLNEGVETIFGYPGGTIMPVYDALYDYRDRINHILVRHEQGAVHAAQGYARVSGRTGVCLVTSGPGATNTITGIADAMMDSTPIVIICGQVGSSFLGSDAFQEVNMIGITQAVTKWNCQVKRAEDISSVISKAFYIASTGRPGPVLIEITKDAQFELCDYDYVKVLSIRGYMPSPIIDNSKIDLAVKLINKAKRPMLLAGQGVILANAEEEFKQFIEKSGMPVAQTLLGLSSLPSSHTQLVGMLGMHGNYAPNIKNEQCDLIIAVGMRFDDRVTGDPKEFGKNAKIIHLDIDPSEINKIIHADIPIIGDVKQTLPLLTALIDKREHISWLNEFKVCYKKEFDIVIKDSVTPQYGEIKMGEVISKVSACYNDDAVLVTDVGQQQMASARYFRFSKNRSIITSGGLGTMGFGLPAAIGAKIGAPNRDVCLISGDGGIQMNIQELCTILQTEISIKIIILNNSFLGMVRQWQDMFFDKRYSFTEMKNPDFGLIAKANGLEYLHIDDRKHLDKAIMMMKKSKKSFVLEVKVEGQENIFPMIPAGQKVSNILLK